MRVAEDRQRETCAPPRNRSSVCRPQSHRPTGCSRATLPPAARARPSRRPARRACSFGCRPRWYRRDPRTSPPAARPPSTASSGHRPTPPNSPLSARRRSNHPPRSDGRVTISSCLVEAPDAVPVSGAVQALPVSPEGGTMSRTVDVAACSFSLRSPAAASPGAAPCSTAIASCSRPWRVNRRASIMSTLGRITFIS